VGGCVVGVRGGVCCGGGGWCGGRGGSDSAYVKKCPHRPSVKQCWELGGEKQVHEK